MSNLAGEAHFDRPHTANRSDANTEVERAKLESRRVAIDEVADEMKTSRGSAHYIFHVVLQYRKVYAR